MQNKKYVGIIGLLALILFFFFIPIDNYDNYPKMLPTVAAICVAGTFALLVKLEVFNLNDEWVKVAPIVAAVCFAVFAFRGCAGVKSELQENGVLTEGKVLGGVTETTTRRGSSSSIDYVNYVYKTKEGYSYNGRHYDASGGSFTNVPVPVLYSAKYPTISIVLNSEEDVRKYLKVDSIKTISVLDLEEMTNIAEADSLTNYLKQISPLWARATQTENATWVYRGGSTMIEIDFVNNLYMLEMKSLNDCMALQTSFQNAGYISTTIKGDDEKEALLYMNEESGKIAYMYRDTSMDQSKGSYRQLSAFAMKYIFIFSGLKDDFSFFAADEGQEGITTRQIE